MNEFSEKLYNELKHETKEFWNFVEDPKENRYYLNQGYYDQARIYDVIKDLLASGRLVATSDISMSELDVW